MKSKYLLIIFYIILFSISVYGQPAAPSGLTVTAATPIRIDISFTDNSSDEDNFVLERKTGAGGTYKEFYLINPNVTRYYDYSAKPNTTYFYRVKAVNGSGSSAYATEQSATTGSESSPTATMSLPLTAFVGETVLVDARGSTNVCPSPQADGTKSVNITYGDGSGVYSELLAGGYVWRSAGTFTPVLTVKNCSGVSATYNSSSITISEIPTANSGSIITDSCLVGGTGNNIQVLIDQGTAAANTTCYNNAVTRASQRNASEQEIILPAGAIYNAPATPVPSGAGSGNKYITIKSANMASMPERKRVSSADSANMPIFQAITANGFGAVALDIPPNAHHYRFQGIRFKRDSNSVAISRAIFVGFGAVLATQAHHIIFDRIWVDAGPSPTSSNMQNVRVSIDSYGKEISILYSYLGDNVLRGGGVDASSVSLSAGEGPVGIVGNTLIATSENFSISGSSFAQFATLSAATLTSATLSSAQNIAVDQPIAFKVDGVYHPHYTTVVRSVTGNNITFDPLRKVPDVPGEADWAAGIPSYLFFYNNYLEKPLRWRVSDPSWDGNSDYQIKNAIEAKCGRYLNFFGNYIRNMWIGDQGYTGFVLSVSGAGGGCNSNAAEIRNVQLANNLFRDMASSHIILGHMHTTPISATTRFVTIRNNVDINVGNFDTCCSTSGIAMNLDFKRYLGFIHYIHNTHDTGGSGFWNIAAFGSDGGVQGGTMMWWNNVHEHGQLGFISSVHGIGTPAIENHLPPGDTTTWNKNLLFNIGGASYPASGIYTTGTWSSHFVDYANGNLTLASGNAGKNAATDGTDVGADINEVKTAIGASTTSFKTATIKVFTGDFTGANTRKCNWHANPRCEQ